MARNSIIIGVCLFVATTAFAQDTKPAVKDTVITVSVKDELASIAQRKKQLEELFKELTTQENFLLQVANDSLKIRVPKQGKK